MRETEPGEPGEPGERVGYGAGEIVVGEIEAL